MVNPDIFSLEYLRHLTACGVLSPAVLYLVQALGAAACSSISFDIVCEDRNRPLRLNATKNLLLWPCDLTGAGDTALQISTRLLFEDTRRRRIWHSERESCEEHCSVKTFPSLVKQMLYKI